MKRRHIDAIKAREQAATPGPWWVPMHVIIGDDDGLRAVYSEHDEIGEFAKDDAEFIAGSRQDIPDLLAEVERNAAEYAELEHRFNMQTDYLAEKLNEIEQLRAERDAAIGDLRRFTYCNTCIFGPESDHSKYP